MSQMPIGRSVSLDGRHLDDYEEMGFREFTYKGIVVYRGDGNGMICLKTKI